jgi:hypothetical protein
MPAKRPLDVNSLAKQIVDDVTDGAGPKDQDDSEDH